MQGLDRVAAIKTRYGGRFVQAINGIEGSLAGRYDWFYFINGYEGDRSAAEYVLHPGDVEWWDFRSWQGGAKQVPVVVGAFPEPFLHGYGGKRLETLVVTTDPVAGRVLAKLLHSSFCLPVGRGGCGRRWRGNTLVMNAGYPRFLAESAGAGKPVHFTFDGDFRDLLNGKYRYRYDVKP